MTPELYFLLTVLGLPVAMLGIALLSASYDDDTEQLLDWKQTRSAKQEAELYASDTQDMLKAVNRYRRSRGAPERSLDQITEHSWANLDLYD